MKNSDRYIQELIKIAGIEGISRSDGVDAREKALSEWLDRWVAVQTVNQSILDRTFTSEEEDFIKYHLAKVAGENLMDECAHINRKKNSIEVKIVAIKKNIV